MALLLFTFFLSLLASITFVGDYLAYLIKGREVHGYEWLNLITALMGWTTLFYLINK